MLVSGLRKTVAVGFRRRKVEILKGVDLVVHHSEVFGLLGPNGAGKTTTVKVALGPDEADRRQVRLGVGGLADVGYLPENPYFYDYLSGREFLGFCARLFELDGATRHERVEQLLRDVGLEAAAACICASIRRACCSASASPRRWSTTRARAARRADDGPRSGRPRRGEAHHRAASTSGARRCMFNSHILSDVHELCSRIAIMRGGRVVWQGAVDEALDEAPSLEDFFMKVVTA